MREVFEPVREVIDYFDRPLKGVAEFGGVPHRFCLAEWESPPPDVAARRETLEPWLLERWDPDVNRYELVPVSPYAGTAVWLRAEFSGTEPGFEPSSALRVRWRPAPVAERLERILEAQRWGGPRGCDLGTPAYLCVGFYLTPVDLETIRPELWRYPDPPSIGDEGWYRKSVPVFPAEARSRAKAPCGYFQGIWFTYAPCLCVD